jgi:hypothetical protein
MNRFFDVIGGNPTAFLQKTFQNIKNNSKKQLLNKWLCRICVLEKARG